MLKKAINGADVVHKLLHEYGERNKEGILYYLADDIHWVGTAIHEHKFGKEEVKKLLEDDLKTDPTPYDIEIIEWKEMVIQPDISTIFLLMKTCQRGNTDFTMECRNTYTCYNTQDGFKICSWHCSLATALQTESEYFPISFAENIMKKATLDALTHIMNRASFEESIQTYLQKEEAGFAFILIDLDNFKFVNDRYGHQCGDEVLIFVAKQLTQAFDKTDLVARLGGDEFVAFVPSISDSENVQQKINTFIQALSFTMYFNNQPYIPSASVGVYICKENHGICYEQCYKAADAAMYKAKNSGKSTWHINES